MSLYRHYVLAAGGTGEHMVPAHAVAQELMARGHRVALVTDERGTQYPGLFEDVQTHVLPAGRMAGGVKGWIAGLRQILEGRRMARQLYESSSPLRSAASAAILRCPRCWAALPRRFRRSFTIRTRSLAA